MPPLDSDSDPDSAAATAAPSAASARRQFLTVFPSIMLPMFLAVVDQTIVATALPAIAASLGDVDRLSWIVVSYLVATTIAAPVYGRLGDVLGRRRLMFVALAVFIGASVLCALSQSMLMLTVARILQGAGGGGLMTLSQALIGEAIPPRERARYQGYLAAVAVTSSTFGPVVGGFLTESFGWQSVFLVNVPVGALAALLALRLPQRAGTGEAFRFDTPGLLLFATFIASTLIMLEGSRAALSGDVLMPLVLATVALAAVILLIRRERRTPSPLLPIPLLKHPAIWRCDAAAAFHGATLVSLITFLPLYFRMVHGTSAAVTGFLIIPMTIGIGVGSLITGRIVGRTGATAVFPSVGLAIVVPGLAFVALASPYLGAVTLSLIFGVLAIFMGTVMGVVQLTVQLAAGSRQLGAGAASVQFSRSLGAAVGTAIVGSVLFATLTLASPGIGDAVGRILEEGPAALHGLSAIQRQSIEAGLGQAFRNAFFCTAAFAAAAMLLFWTQPIRRV
ncbi:MFS transporter [Aurantimonas sp. VKM B-3413]|uniref:MFS transporter n=1 Tax=Aurantimonas sp. VKM B-3413 TaxID=2779401 RepID=UPI001E3FEC90|nr:MFS transporter [Aurantimonas sp. VKM B-3413]MCB8837402.1 MFS transporter [Aurantimonas sp. VKM B-3413]